MSMMETRARKRRAQLENNENVIMQQEASENHASSDEEDSLNTTKKKQRRTLEDNDDSSLETEEEETSIADAPHPPFELLSVVVIESIFSFLDNPRDVFNLSNCAKYIRKCVTPEIVIRSAVFGGRKTRAVVKNLIPSIENKSIHVPSTLRLLRLVNGTRCERGDQCFSYNVVDKMSGAIPAKNAERLPFAMMICPECDKCTSCPTSSRILHRTLGKEMSARFEHSGCRLLREPYMEAATGERVGPLVLALQVQQMDATKYASNEKKRQAFERLFETIDQDAPFDSTARSQVIVDAYNTAQNDYDAFVAAEKERKKKKCQEERDEQARKRKKTEMVVYRKIESLLEDYKHKDLVLNCTWSVWGNCTFNYIPVHAILNDLIRAPSKATNKKIAALVGKARIFVDKIYSYGFVKESPNWCLGVLASRQERHVKIVVDYIKNLPPERQEKILLAKSSYYGCGKMRNFVRLIEEGKPFDALLQLLFIDTSWSKGLDPQIFCPIVKEHDATQRDNLVALAEGIWREYFPRYNSHQDYGSEESFRRNFASCCREYNELHSSIRAYLAHPHTIAFLQEKDTPVRNPHQRFTRQNAIDKMYTDDHCLYLLYEHAFGRLLRRHRNFFRNPSSYGF